MEPGHLSNQFKVDAERLNFLDEAECIFALEKTEWLSDGDFRNDIEAV